MAKDNLDRILFALEAEKTIYEKLLSLSLEKKDLIIEGKVNELNNIVQMEGSMILEIGKIEDEREKAVEELAKELKLSRENITVTYICDVLKDNRCIQIREVAKAIANILGQFKEVNDINGKLIKQSLEYINFSINLITDSIQPHNGIYEANADEDKEKKVSLFDAKV